MFNKSLDKSFRKEEFKIMDGETGSILFPSNNISELNKSSSSSSFTRNRLLRHMGTGVVNQETPVVPPPKASLVPLNMNPQRPKPNNFVSEVDCPKDSKKINHRQKPFSATKEFICDESTTTIEASTSEDSISSCSSKEDDEEFIRKQVEARVEYRGMGSLECCSDLQPIPSTTLPVCLAKPVPFEKTDLHLEVDHSDEIDPHLLALEEYLSDAKLKAATGEDNLKNVKHLEIIVNTTNNSLGDVGSKLPNLEELKLNGSTLPSIRDLGTSLQFVRILWLSRCGIRELDGISTFSKLKELYLSYNDIEDISDLSGMEELEVLDLEGNNIEDELQLIYLSDCKNLTSLTLSGNPLVVKMAGYRSMVRTTLPTLEYLDDSPLLEEDDDDKMDDRGVSPIKKQGELENEFEMLKKSIKFTRMESLDETLNDNPLILTISNRLYNPTDSNMIRNITTATPILDGGRPQSASFFRRPTTTSSSSSIFRSMSKSRIGLRPSTSSQMRPTSSMMTRPTTSSSMARPMTASLSSSDRSNSARTSFSNRKSSTEDDSSSHLTYKAKEVYCGNIVQGLKKKKQQEPAFLLGTDKTDVEMHILAQVQQHKIQTISEPNEELEEFLNEVYDGIDVIEESHHTFSRKTKAESFSLDSIPVYEDIFNNGPTTTLRSSSKNKR